VSTFKVEVVPVSLAPHPNADTLSLVRVYGFTAIVRTAEWQGRDRGVYIPVDAIVPDRPEFAFLEGHRRIKARRLRGIFSMGLLVEAPDGAQIGDDLTVPMGIEKYDPDLLQDTGTHVCNEDAPAPPGLAPNYTDIESLRRHRSVFAEREIVVTTEKIHGANMRATFRDGVLHIGSRTRWKRLDVSHVWSRAAAASDLDAKIRRLPEGVIVYGEAYGQVQDLRYGLNGPGGIRFRAFDMFDPAAGRYLDYQQFFDACEESGIDRVPALSWGPVDFDQLLALAEEDSRTAPGQLMEGIVVKPEHERFDDRIGRVILKLHSQRYLLRKGT
jgi:RNA ligase (TIGR02306 family)